MLLSIRKMTPFPSREKVIPAVRCIRHKYINGRTNFRMPSALRQYHVSFGTINRIINNTFCSAVSSRAPDFTYKGLFVIYKFKGYQKK